MGRRKIGSRENSYLNGEWAKHGRPWGKKIASKKRRKKGKKDIKEIVHAPSDSGEIV